MDTVRFDVAHPEIRNRDDAHDSSVNVHHPHTRINPRTLASRIPRQLVNPPRDLRDSPCLPHPQPATYPLVLCNYLLPA